MTNLRDQLADLAGSPGEPTTTQADADLARGRSALRRRRVLQGATGSAFVAVIAAVAIGVTTVGGPGAGSGSAPLAGGTTAATTTATVSFELVAYKGEQPAGFSVDKVPAGFEVQGVDDSVLTLAPKGAKPRNSAEPQGDAPDTDPYSFVGKVAVTLQSLDEKGTPAGQKVKVGDTTGTLVKKEGDKDGRTLYLPQPNGINLQVQVWDGIGWTADEITAFAAGIHVNANAKPGRG